MAVAVRRTYWQQAVTEASRCQRTELAEATEAVPITQVKQPSLLLGGQLGA
jgi:hypothetical protein